MPPSQHYRYAAEPGCGNGELTRKLAGRCDRVIASDYFPDAVRLAIETTAGIAEVTVARHALPGGIPEGIDLAVLSEVLYYLDPADRSELPDRVHSRIDRMITNPVRGNPSV